MEGRDQVQPAGPGEAFSLPTSTEEGDFPLMKGQTVLDVNCFVLLTVERVTKVKHNLAEQEQSGRPVLEGVARQRVIDALEVTALHLEAVAAWYFG